MKPGRPTPPPSPSADGAAAAPGRPVPVLTHVSPDREYELEERPLSLQLMARLFAYTHPYRAKRAVLLLTVVLRSLQLPLLAWAIGAIITGPVTSGDYAAVLFSGLAFLGFALFSQFTFHFRQRLALEIGEAVIHDLRRDLLEKILSFPMGFFHRTKLGRILSRFSSDAESVRIGVQDVFFVSLVQAGQGFFAALLMAWYDWVLFLIVLAIAPVLWGINRLFKARLSHAYRVVLEGWSRITATIAESVNGVRVTQGFVRQRINADFFSGLLLDQSHYNLGVARTSGIFLPLLELNTQFFTALLIVVGGWRVLHPEIHQPVGTLVHFFFLANLFFDPIRVLGNQYNQAMTAMAGAERVFRLLDAEPDWQDPPGAQPLPDPRSAPAHPTHLASPPAADALPSSPSTLGARIAFSGVTFSYQPGRPVLHDISFTAEPGQTIALVGHTGSGKSSIINLVTKFYLPDSGLITIDGLDLRTLSSASLHRQTGIINQQNFLFSGTLLDNIRYARPGATEEEVVEAVRRLGFLDLIGALPSGLATAVGEKGARLSLGQRQLVCFARAYLADPRIFILDEATSAIDVVTEARIQASLSTLLQGRTSFIVAHRLSTIRHADQVLVLDQGRLAERGTHDSLLRLGGLYARLHEEFSRTEHDPSPRTNPPFSFK